ncbi:PspC domain-containing protein [Aeromicrobium endophyticum]|nr:PspC domain-containing protein [Aeromicrobium endophyticum]
MNDTQQLPPPPPGADDDFDPHRLRTIADMRRSSDDRVVAGVCAGAARYLNIDPIVVRVIIAVLMIAGFAGVILYLAAWLLLPADDAERSVAADWFNLDRNERQVRVIGLVTAVAVAALSFIGDSSWAWWGDTSWWIVPVGLLLYLVWVRPRQRRAARSSADARATGGTPVFEATHPGAPLTGAVTRTPRRRRSPALFVLTSSITAIALAVTWIYDETRHDVHWTAYVAVALGIVALGILIGTVLGDAGWLMAIGVLLAVALAVGSVFPSGRIGQQTPSPTVAADVADAYRHGIGEFALDLTGVTDPDQLQGRTIAIRAGIGETRVIVPGGLRVRVEAHLDAGQVEVLGRELAGVDVSASDGSTTSDGTGAPPPDGEPLTITIDQKIGHVEVTSR